MALTFKSRAASPFAPLYANVQFWDDHYFAWLPNHPVYETFELMTTRRGPVGQLVWAFFTERAGSKRQVHYYNDPAVATSTNRRYAHMSIDAPLYSDSCARRIAVCFLDERGDAVTFEARFARPDAPMSHAGLSDQSGHNKERFVLYFYRDRATATADAFLTIAGEPVTLFLQNDLRVAYSQVVYTAIVPFGTLPAQPHDVLHDGTGVTGYVHQDYGHAIELSFEEAIDPSRRSTTVFAVSLDDYRNLSSGTVEVSPDEQGASLHYAPELPAWASAYGFSVHWDSDSPNITISRTTQISAAE